MRLKNKVAVITGAASGIGEACARLFAAEGAAVVVADINEAGMRRVGDGIRAAGGRVLEVYTDVTSEEQCRRLMDRAADTYGKVDILVTNPWWHPWKNAHDTSAEEWRRTMAITLDGVFYCCKYALGKFPKEGGVIINISSIQGISGMASCAAYMAAKGAVNQLTRSIAIDFGPKGVRANAVCPGIIMSPPTVESFRNQEEIKDAESRTLLRRLGSSEDVANACLFLASDEGSYITGSILVVDGGMTAVHP